MARPRTSGSLPSPRFPGTDEVRPALAIKALALDLIRDSVFVLDEDGRFLDVNEAAWRTLGYSRDELLAMDLRELDTPDFAHLVGDRIAEIRATGAALFESAHRRKDGTVVPVEINCRRVTVDGHRLLVSSIRDISRRKANDEALQRAIEEARRNMEALAERNRQVTCLAAMGRELQACDTRDSFWQWTGDFLEDLFPGVGGELLVADPNGRLARTASWGERLAACDPASRDCLATFPGAAPAGETTPGPVSCARHEDACSESYCVPITSRTGTHAILRTAGDSGIRPSGAPSHGPANGLAVAAAEQISSALTNLMLREALREMAMRDPLTGLYNRRALEEALDRELSRAKREGGTLGVLMLDLDHFKVFNDTFGHEAGDDVLRSLAGLLSHGIRLTDVACRYGGEEFTILLPGASVEGAAARAEVLRRGIRDLPGLAGEVAASVGAAVYPFHGSSPGDLLRAADVALYRAKAGGRNRVETFREG